jgi:type II secretory pathway pseudopilin PulG
MRPASCVLRPASATTPPAASRQPPARSAFTLVEILVSIMVFSLAGTAMVTVLFTATKLFQNAESAREAGDEATAVLATIRDDLARMVPAADGGFVAVEQLAADRTGNCRLIVKVSNPDRGAIAADGAHARQLVAYWIRDDSGLPSLVRAAIDAADSLGTGAGTGLEADRLGLLGDGSVISRGVLHFGVWLNNPAAPRTLNQWQNCPPAVGGDYLTEDTPDDPDTTTDEFVPADPFPTAVRISLILTGGGRHAARGRLVTEIAVSGAVSGARISGLDAGVATSANSYLRIGDEWLDVTGFRAGRLDAERGALRSTAAAHARGAEVTLGRWYAVVHSLDE